MIVVLAAAVGVVGAPTVFAELALDGHDVVVYADVEIFFLVTRRGEFYEVASALFFIYLCDVGPGDADLILPIDRFVAVESLSLDIEQMIGVTVAGVFGRNAPEGSEGTHGGS
jgi:hypothetical protein